MSRAASRDFGRRVRDRFNNGDIRSASPLPPPAPEPTNGNRAIHQVALAYAEASPLEAARAFAAGIALQVRSGRVAALCAAADALSASDPEFGAAVANRLRVTIPPGPTSSDLAEKGD